MFNWMGLFLFLATAVTFYVFGAICMIAFSGKSEYEAKMEAFNAGYERGKAEEKERIGKLLDKYTEDLGKGTRENNKE